MNNIIEQKGHVFFWELIDYSEKDEYGDLSAKIFIEGDCKNYRFKWLKLSYHKDEMGKDNAVHKKPSDLLAGWQKPALDSTSMLVLDFVCKNKGVVL